MKRSRYTLSSLLTAAVFGVTTYAHADTYRLEKDAAFETGCFAMCDCPVSIESLTGSFTLRHLAFDGLFDVYEVSDVQWMLPRIPQPVAITGSGTYRVGGEFAIQERLSLDLSVDGSETRHFDSGLVAGGGEFPRIDIVISLNGLVTCTDTVFDVRAASVTPTSHEVFPTSLQPRVIPSPFHNRTQVLLDLSTSAPVDLQIFDVRGRVVRSLLAGIWLTPGPHTIEWDGRSEDGVECAAGVYIVRSRAGEWRGESRVVKSR
jgi:hypothetical protein